METTTEQVGDVLKIKIIGRFTANNADEFKQSLLTYAKTIKQILLDLSQMDYIDSSGLGALVGAQQEISRQSGQLKLAALQPKPDKVFEITRTKHVLDVYNNVEEAINSFK